MKKLYSFDLFDTLVERIVSHPRDVFLLVEATGVIKYKCPIFNFFSFKFFRVISEKLARFFSRKEDINIYNIYSILSMFVSNAEEVLQKEIEIEFYVIRPKPENISILREMIDKGVDVCIISDMYLPISVIKDILIKNEIEVEKVYVSSEIGLTKATGNLFKHVVNDFNISFSEVLHYGDNEWSDIDVPRKMGIDCIHVYAYSPQESLDLFDCFKSKAVKDQYYKVGYNFCGPVAYFFANFIKKNINDFNSNVVFGARDSYLFKYAFELFFNKSNEYKTFYTRLSRKLVYLPEAFFSGNYDKFFEGGIDCENFFSRIQVKCPDCFVGQSLSSNKKSILEFLKNDEDFNTYLRKESTIVKKYLMENGFNKKTFFIDLGWRGSIQDSLNVIFDDEILLKGLYLGTVNNDFNKKGLLFENKKSFFSYFYVMQCISIFEFLFTEPERSLNTIDEFHNFIFTNDESIKQIEIRKNIKNGGEQFLLDFHEMNEKFKFDEKIIKKSINKLIKRKTMCVDDDLVFSFMGLKHSAGFNGSLQSKMIEYDGFSIMSYLRSPWKSYFMSELKKHSRLQYFSFLILFHNIFFFVFYEHFKIIFRKLRAIVKG
jgi:HAD superfamily hydrolase (TIGR01549 family)